MNQTLTRLTSAPLAMPDNDRVVPLPSIAQSLDDHTLLSLLLERLLQGDIPTDRVAADLLDRFGSLGGVAAAEILELRRIDALDDPAISGLKLIREFGVRMARSEACHRPVITSFDALIAYVRTTLAHLPREQFRALYLDRRNILMRDELVTDGSVDHAPVYPCEVLRRALELSASALVLVHNHPSGDPTPSAADIQITRQIVQGAKALNIRVHDHLVVGREGTASFKSLGLI